MNRRVTSKCELNLLDVKLSSPLKFLAFEGTVIFYFYTNKLCSVTFFFFLVFLENRWKSYCKKFSQQKVKFRDLYVAPNVSIYKTYLCVEADEKFKTKLLTIGNIHTVL